MTILLNLKREWKFPDKPKKDNNKQKSDGKINKNVNASLTSYF